MRITETVLTVMVMIHDAAADRVVVQEREKDWRGLTLPGGHVEAGESLCAAAAREAREETGLTVNDLRLRGVIHWCEERSGRRYLVFAYKTEVFSGELLQDGDEGRAFWMPLEEMRRAKLSPNMDVMLEVFLREDASEAFGQWVEDVSAPMEIF